MECEPCPAGKVTSSPGAMTRADCVTEKGEDFFLKLQFSLNLSVLFNLKP